MSGALIKAAFEVSGVIDGAERRRIWGSEKLVLLALAASAARTTPANQTTTIGVSEVMRLTGNSARAVFKAYSVLQESGYITRTAGPVGTVSTTIVHPHADIQAKPLKQRPKLSRALARAVMERDGYRCVVCQTHIDLTCDHLIPVSKGGGNTLENLQTMCRTHNRQKGAKLP